jgi:hypothetical protein
MFIGSSIAIGSPSSLFTGAADTGAFKTQWNTANGGVSASNQIKLPLQSSGTYNFEVDWGDGNSDTITVWDQAETTHTYSSSGIYDVVINGDLTGWRFNGGGDDLKILEISQWGDINLGNSNGYFYGCNNLQITATDALDLTGTTNFANAFRDCLVLNSDFLNNADTSLVQSFSAAFRGCLIFNQPILFSTASATTYSSTFRDCKQLNQDLNLDGTGVSSYSAMLLGATAFDGDISGIDVSDATTMSNMLSGTSFSTTNYDAALIAWEQLDLNTGVSFHAGTAKYSAGAAATARAVLVSVSAPPGGYSWTITDGGPV